MSKYNTKENTIYIRVSKEMKVDIKKEASKTGESMSNWCRRQLYEILEKGN